MPSGLMAGFQTNWRAEGSGSRPAMFLHCSLGHSGAWGGLVRGLKDDLKIIAMDLPGHGHSGPWARDLDWLDQSARMVVALLDNFDGPADIIGHSFGGAVAVRVAIDRPDLVRSLTLAEPVIFSAAAQSGATEYHRHIDEVGHFPALIAQGQNDAIAREFSEMWGSGVSWENTPELQKQYVRDRIGTVVNGSPALFGIGAASMALTDIARIDIPVLLIEGDATHEIIPAIMNALQGCLSNVDRVVVKGAGHMVPITHACEVGKTLRAFLKL